MTSRVTAGAAQLGGRRTIRRLLFTTGAIAGVFMVAAGVFIGAIVYSWSRPCASADVRPHADVRVEMDETPAVGEPVEAEASITPCRQPSGPVTAEVQLGRTATLAGGSETWTGTLDEGETGRFRFTVVFTEPGRTEVGVRATYPHAEASTGFFEASGDADVFASVQGDQRPPEGTSTPMPVTTPTGFGP